MQEFLKGRLKLEEKKELRRLIKQSLDEDIGGGDVTTGCLFGRDFSVEAALIAKEDCLLCGIGVFREVFLCLSSECDFRFRYGDGDYLSGNTEVGRVVCGVKTMMKAERTALNFLQHLSGVATLTRAFVEKAGGLNIYDTRKTKPMLRNLEKYAVRIGGGRNHRFGLFDMVMIKDNHIFAFMKKNGITDRAEAVYRSVRKARESSAGRYKVEVEVENAVEALRAFEAGADIIMFDNADIAELEKFREAVGEGRKGLEIEWSGNVNFGNIGSLKGLRADRVSVGAITHSARAVDFSLKIRGAECT